MEGGAQCMHAASSAGLVRACDIDKTRRFLCAIKAAHAS